jgi:Tfp pilus assembly protein PilX
MNTKKGVVFIVVLGVLVLLVLLGVTFSLLTRIEKSSSEAYMNQIRAKLIAQSGIETAIAQLRSNTAQFPEDAIFWGEDTNKNGKLDTGEDQNKNGRLDVGDCPIEYALRPSFAAMDDKIT